MAIRPIFMPTVTGHSLVKVIPIDFTWHSGPSMEERQKCMLSLHIAAIKQLQLKDILEISTRSLDKRGIKLSAFNLKLETPKNFIASVESLYQGSKVFSKGGPYTDLYHKSSYEAKTDIRLRLSGQLLGFKYFQQEWPLFPQAAFYDWLYRTALLQQLELADYLLNFDAFTDIEFNQKKSLNCQARAAALYVTLVKRDMLQADPLKLYSTFSNLT